MQTLSRCAPGRARRRSSRGASRATLGVRLVLALIGTTALAVSAPVASARSFRAACGTPAPRHARCDAEIVTTAPSSAGVAAAPLVTAAPSGYGPADLASAYSLPVATGAGAGETVAIVDAYDDPNAESDLGVYRSRYGLTACTTANGCFRKVNQTGGDDALRAPTPAGPRRSRSTSTWSRRSARTATSCSSRRRRASFANLGTAVDTAATMGATQISNSYGGERVRRDDSPDDPTTTTPASTITVSSGDNGYGVAVPGLVAVRHGGRRHEPGPASNSRGWSETAWSGAGSGCSALRPQAGLADGHRLRAADGGRRLGRRRSEHRRRRLRQLRRVAPGG